MQGNVPTLEKKAIKAALSENWEEAIQINTEILEHNENNINAKVRLGRAYLQTKQFPKAQKLFDEVLKVDPINKIALKNIELAKSKKTASVSNGNGRKSLIKAPGTSTEQNVEITARGVTCAKFNYGTPFDLKVSKTKVDILCDGKVIGALSDKSIVARMNHANELEANLSAAFIRGDKKTMTILLESSEPVFKGDKQDIKPYMKKGVIEEVELEIESFDDE